MNEFVFVQRHFRKTINGCTSVDFFVYKMNTTRLEKKY